MTPHRASIFPHPPRAPSNKVFEKTENHSLRITVGGSADTVCVASFYSRKIAGSSQATECRSPNQCSRLARCGIDIRLLKGDIQRSSSVRFFPHSISCPCRRTNSSGDCHNIYATIKGRPSTSHEILVDVAYTYKAKKHKQPILYRCYLKPLI